MKRNLILTGTPWVGKVDIIRRIAESLAGYHICGFHTREILRKGRLMGLRLCPFDGKDSIIAHILFPGPYKKNGYGVDPTAIDESLESTLLARRSADIYLVDELCGMECFSTSFNTAMFYIFDSAKPVIATLSDAGLELIAGIRMRRDTELWEITPKNRYFMPGRVVNWIRNSSGKAQ